MYANVVSTVLHRQYYALNVVASINGLIGSLLVCGVECATVPAFLITLTDLLTLKDATKYFRLCDQSAL